MKFSNYIFQFLVFYFLIITKASAQTSSIGLEHYWSSINELPHSYENFEVDNGIILPEKLEEFNEKTQSFKNSFK
mgnify:CR=1 FL=1